MPRSSPRVPVLSKPHGISVRPEVYAKLKAESECTGKTIGQLVRDACEADPAFAAFAEAEIGGEA